MLSSIRRSVRWAWSRLWDAMPDWPILVRACERFPESWFDQAD
jgi:hypothetical protein